MYWSSRKVSVIFSDLNKTSIFPTDFRNIPNIKFQENPSNGSRVLPCGQKNIQYESNILFHNFINVPALQKPKIIRREFDNISVHGLNHVQKDMLRICEACTDGEVRYFDNLL